MFALQVKKLEPYLIVYCQNSDLVEDKVREGLGRMLDRGEVVKLDNKGREGSPSVPKQELKLWPLNL